MDRRRIGDANLLKAPPRDRRPEPAIRIRTNAVLTFGPHVGELITDLLEAIQRKRLPGPATRDVLRTILPDERAPRPLPDLPIITDAASFREAGRRINEWRREGRINSAEARELAGLARDLWCIAQDAASAERQARWQRELDR